MFGNNYMYGNNSSNFSDDVAINLVSKVSNRIHIVTRPDERIFILTQDDGAYLECVRHAYLVGKAYDIGAVASSERMCGHLKGPIRYKSIDTEIILEQGLINNVTSETTANIVTTIATASAIALHENIREGIEYEAAEILCAKEPRIFNEAYYPGGSPQALCAFDHYQIICTFTFVVGFLGYAFLAGPIPAIGYLVGASTFKATAIALSYFTANPIALLVIPKVAGVGSGMATIYGLNR